MTVWLLIANDEQVHSLGMETYYNLSYFGRILIYLHSAINPIAYNLISTKFRRAFSAFLLNKSSYSSQLQNNNNAIINNNVKKINKDNDNHRHQQFDAANKEHFNYDALNQQILTHQQQTKIPVQADNSKPQIGKPNKAIVDYRRTSAAAAAPASSDVPNEMRNNLTDTRDKSTSGNNCPSEESNSQVQSLSSTMICSKQDSNQTDSICFRPARLPLKAATLVGELQNNDHFQDYDDNDEDEEEDNTTTNGQSVWLTQEIVIAKLDDISIHIENHATIKNISM